jgi:short-subunit dehydrogenase
MNNLKGKTALITGASSGLGEAYAIKLASLGVKVILVARRAERLRVLADRITAEHGILAASVLPMDLSAKGAGSALAKVLKGRGTQIDILVNNAGFGQTIKFVDESSDFIADELNVNITTLVELTHAFLPGMVERNDGIVINIASTAAFQSLPYMAVYGASKAFVLSFTEALWGETRGTGVKVLAVCPGPTATEFFDTNGTTPALGRFIRSSANVIDSTFKALGKQNSPAAIVDGPLNKITANLSRFFTRRFSIKLSARVMKSGKKS